jgi:hypothetical protein
VCHFDLKRNKPGAEKWSLWTSFLSKAGAYTSPTGNSVNEVEGAMTKPASLGYCEQQATENLDQAMERMRNVLRKPLKLTATLKRRALKNRAAGKPVIVRPPR